MTKDAKFSKVDKGGTKITFNVLLIAPQSITPEGLYAIIAYMLQNNTFKSGVDEAMLFDVHSFKLSSSKLLYYELLYLNLLFMCLMLLILFN